MGRTSCLPLLLDRATHTRKTVKPACVLLCSLLASCCNVSYCQCFLALPDMLASFEPFKLKDYKTYVAALSESAVSAHQRLMHIVNTYYD